MDGEREADPVEVEVSFEVYEQPDGSELELALPSQSQKFWDRLRGDSEEATKLRAEQMTRIEILEPDFVLENLDKFADGQTKLWPIEGGATIVALDISGFTKMSENALENEDWTQGAGGGSQQINQLIGDFFGRVQTQASVAGGDLIGLGGDEVLYMFHGSGHQERALHFTSQAKESLGDEDLGIHVSGGVASGDVVIGAVRLDEKRSLPVVLGAPIIEARALQGVASKEKGEVVVHSAVAPELLSGGKAVKQDFGVALDSYVNFDAVAEYWSENKQLSSNQPAPTFENIQTAARLMHPHHRYVAEYEGIPHEIYAGERRPMTVMFVDMDISDLHNQVVSEVKHETTSTTSSAVKDLEDMLQATNAVARKYHGNFEKLVIGASTKAMLVFMKDRQEANALRASQEEMNWLAGHGIDSSAGVYSGTGYRGMTGALESGEPKAELGVISPVANRAARLSKQAGKGVFLADSLTVMHAENVLKVDPVRKVSQKALGLKGVEQDRAIIEIGRVENIESTLEHSGGVRSVGREVQKRQMEEAFVRVMDTGKQMVETIVAESGEGKSLLTDELIRLHYFEKRDAEVLKGRAMEDSSEDAYSVWRAPVKKLFQIEDGDLPIVVIEKVRAMLGEVKAEYVELAELFIDEFGLAKLQVTADRHYPGFGTRAAEILSELIAKKTEDKPMIIAMEDLHWADYQSNALLKEVIAGTKDAPVLFHLVSRPKENLMEFLRLDQDTKVDIELGPIGREHWADFIAAQFPINGIRQYSELHRAGLQSRQKEDSAVYRLMRANERLTDMTYRFSGGNPYIGRTVMKYLLNYHEIHPERTHEVGGVTRPIQFFEEHDGMYNFLDYIDEKLLPEAGQWDMALEKMFDAARSAEERVALKFAAKTREFKDKELADLLGIEVKTLAPFLEHWEKMGWIEQGAETYSFTHANVQATADRSIGEVLMRHSDGSVEVLTNEVLSRRVGQYKEKHGGGLEDLARLYGASDDAPKGIHYNILFGDASFARQDGVNYQVAINAYNRAISLFETNYVEGLSKHNGSTGKHWEELGADVRAHVVSDALEAYSKLAKVYAMVEANEAGVEGTIKSIDVALERLATFGESLPSDEMRWLSRVELEILKASQLYRANRIEEAAELLRSNAGNEEVLSNGLVFGEQGVTGDARRRMILATYYKTAGRILTRDAELDLGHNLDALGYYDVALALVNPEESSFEEFGVWDEVMASKIEYLTLLGQLTEADAQVKILMKYEEGRGYKVGLVAAKLLWAENMISRGDKNELSVVRDNLYEVLESIRDHAPKKEVSLYRVLINLEETLHDYERAAKLTEAFLPILGAKEGEVSNNQRINRWKAELAWLAAKNQDYTRATILMDELAGADGGGIGANTRPILLMIEAMLASGRGDYDEASRLLSLSYSNFESMSNASKGSMGTVLVEQGLLEKKRGERERSQKYFESALALYGDDEPVEREYIESLMV